MTHGGVHALRLHQLLFEKSAQQNSADLSGAQHGQPFVGKLARKCRFHGACIVDDTAPSVNILPQQAASILGNRSNLLRGMMKFLTKLKMLDCRVAAKRTPELLGQSEVTMPMDS